MAGHKSPSCSLEFGLLGDFLVFPTTSYLSPGDRVSVVCLRKDQIKHVGESVSPKLGFRTWVNEFQVDPDQCSLRAKHVMDWVMFGTEPTEDAWVIPEKTPAKKLPTAPASGA